MIVPLLVSAAWAAGSSLSQGADWPRFRGPNGSGVGALERLPDALDPERNLRWRVELPPGYSSPVVAGELVYLTGVEGDEVATFAIDRESGEIAWRAAAPEPLEGPPRPVNSPAAATPCADAAGVVVFFENVGLLAYDAAGEERWRVALGPFVSPYGMACSPVIAGELVVLLADQDRGGYLVAVERATGKERWRAERKGFTHGYSTPIVHRPAEGPAELIVLGSYRLVGYGLEDGAERWWTDGMSWQAKSTPVLHGDDVIVHSWMASPSELGIRQVSTPWGEALESWDADGDGKLTAKECAELGAERLFFLLDLDGDGGLDEEEWGYVLARGSAQNGLWSFRLGGAGELSEEHRRWRYRRALPNIPSPLVHQGVLYMLKESGIFTALDPASGEVLKDGRIEGALDPYYASPVAAAGRIVTASHTGKVAVIEGGAGWEVLSVVDLGEEIWATPALAEPGVYLRSEEALYLFADEGD